MSHEWNDRQKRMVTNWMKSTYDQFTQRVMTNRQGIAKVAMDWTLSLALLILAAPLVLLAALAVKLTSRGPIFYSQTRLGRGGQPPLTGGDGE